MAKIKTKKEKQSFSEGIRSILEAHSVFLDDSVLEPLVKDFETYFNEVYKPNNKSPYFEYLVKQYMAIFFDLVGEKAEFNELHGINLHRLSNTLKNRFLTLNPTGIWDLQTCLDTHERYYRHLFDNIPFMRRNFTPTMMYSRFTENLSEMAVIAKRKKQEDEDHKKKMERLAQ